MFMNNTETRIQILFSSFTTRYQHDYFKNPKQKSRDSNPKP